MDGSTAGRGQAKLSYSYGAGSRLSVTGILFDVQQRAFPGTDIADAALYRGGSGTSRLGVVNWSHALGTVHGGAPLPNPCRTPSRAPLNRMRSTGVRPTTMYSAMS